MAHRRISRIIEHWTLPQASQVLDHVRRARIELAQVGNFGADFYSLAGDESVAPSWSGMPLGSVKANLDLAAEVIPQIQEAGALVTGQLSTTMHFGNHEEGHGAVRRRAGAACGPPICWARRLALRSKRQLSAMPTAHYGGAPFPAGPTAPIAGA